MKQYISEDRAIYEDMYGCAFSKKLAEFAISHMEVYDPTTKENKKITPITVDGMLEVLKKYGVDIPEEHVYTELYLFNMAKADYPKTCKTDEQRATFVEETLLDPDGNKADVLECFVAKMGNAGIAIHWDRMI